MNRRNLLAAGTAAALIPLTAKAAASPMPTLPTPPVARQEPRRIEQLGRVRVDEYAWMKDDNWQQVLHDPKLIKADVKAHLDAENAYFKAMLASTEPLQAAMFEEMKGRIKEDDSSVPSPDGVWDYYIRYETGAQHPFYCRQPRGKTDGEEILLDAEALARGKAFSEIGAAEHSPDHGLFAYAEDAQGSEVYTIYVKDLATGGILPGPVENTYADFTWSPDSQWLFWTHRDENGRPDKIFRRPARGGAGSDVLVYHEEDEGFFIGVYTLASNGFIAISCGNQETSEIRLISASDPTATPVLVEPRKVGVLYDLEQWGDDFIIRTNAGDAVDFKLVRTPVDKPGAAHWRDFVAHKTGRLIMGITAFKDHLVRLEKSDALNRVVVLNAAHDETVLRFDEEAYAISLEGGYEYDTTTLRFAYQSPTTPKQWFDQDMATGQRTLRKTQEIPSGHNPADYVTRRLNARTADGQEAPIFLLMKKGTRLDGSAPLLLYGYGSYGSSNEPTFNIRQFSLVDRGWIWAVACVRGGSEKGWGWFLDGRKFTKKNTFTDFIACAEHLHGAGYGKPANTVAFGRSAGGMLMGAVANMRPDLFAGIIAGVPFVDELNTMSDASLPLTPPEWPEWGNPLTDPQAYDYIESYAGYEQVRAKPYPAVLAYAGLSDPRVTYWEPEKWTSRLRQHTTSSNPVLLWVNMDAGHAGSAGRFDYLKEIARDLAFATWAVDRGWTRA